MTDVSLTGIPQPACSYQPPDQCTGFVPKSCCERLAESTGAPPTDGAPPIVTQLHFLFVGGLLLISVLFTAITQ